MAIWAFLTANYPKPAGFGPVRSALLQGIKKYGSITAAADAAGLDHRNAGNIVRSIRKQFGEVIVGTRGRGGGAHLTPRGEMLLSYYLKMEREFYQVFAKDLRYLERLVGDDPNLPMRIPRWAQVQEPKTAKSREKSKPVRKRKTSPVLGKTAARSASALKK